MEVIEGSGDIVVEPDWQSILNDVLEIAAANEYWRVMTTEMKERGTLSPANGHSMQRLIMAYLAFDRASKEVAENGSVTKPKRGNSKAIARVSPYFAVMRESGSDADRLEAQLGLSPLHRGKVTKVERKARQKRASDAYIRPVAK